MSNQYACFKKLPSLLRDSGNFKILKKMCLMSNPSIFSFPNEYLHVNRALIPAKWNSNMVKDDFLF